MSNVTGFSIVLWSRLHLVVNDPRILKCVLIMIIVIGILCHTPTVVLEFCLKPGPHDPFRRPMQIMTRVQQTIFALQDCFISGLYIFQTKRFFNLGYPLHTRKVIALLFMVQVVVITLDACLTTLEYVDMFTLKCTVQYVYLSLCHTTLEASTNTS